MSIVTKIFTSKNKEEYENLLTSYKLDLDIYYQTDFLEIDAKLQSGIYEIFCVLENEHIFIYPYIKLPFKEIALTNYFDITSPYGYCGPFCTSAFFLDIAEPIFLKYATESNFVTEFVRYHYLYNDSIVFKKNIDNVKNRIVAILNLDSDWENIWKNEISSTNRNIVRKLEKEKYLFEMHFDTEFIDEFIGMYNKNMQRLNAEEFYNFPADIYRNLFDKLGSKIFIARVVKEGVTYSSSLFFVSGSIITYYLSARNLDYTKVAASNLMLTNVSKYANDRGLKYFNLGGGRKNSFDDPLFRFKMQFTKQSSHYIIGKRIHHSEKYKELIAKFISEYGVEEYLAKKNILQFYRTYSF